MRHFQALQMSRSFPDAGDIVIRDEPCAQSHLFVLHVARGRDQMVLTSLLQAQLAAVVFEEVIFRGVLWTVLRNLGLKEIVVYFISAFLFWMAHFRYLLQGSTYSFWFAIPLLAFLFGYMTWRTKSLTPGTIGHFLFNFLVALYSGVF